MLNFRKTEWNDSYSRNENSILFPKDEVVKFLNRFVVKKIDQSTTKNIIAQKDEIKVLDLGCGIGRAVLLFEEFGLSGYGVDISRVAIEKAKQLAMSHGKNLDEKFKVLGDKVEIPFEDNFFDIAISDSALDSMEFSFAKAYLKELDRTVSKLVYLNIISDESSEASPEKVVTTQHEYGTVQCYFNLDKIKDMLSETSFKISYMRKISEEDLSSGFKTIRFHIVLDKK